MNMPPLLLQLQGVKVIISLVIRLQQSDLLHLKQILMSN